jgi:hypothetical protein
MPEIWPFPADDSLRDSYAFLTDVMRAGSEEKRVTVRNIPRRTISMSHTFTDKSFAIFRAISRRVSSLTSVWVPLWVDSVSISSVAVSQTVFEFTTADYDFTEYCILWNSIEDFELLKIASVGATSITTETGAVSLRSKTLIIPVREGVATKGFSTTRNAFNSYSIDAQFKIIEEQQYGQSYTGVEYKTVPLVPFRPTRTSSLSESIFDKSTELTNESGLFQMYQLLDYIQFSATVEFDLNTRSQILKVRDFLCSLSGRSGPFWLPSYFNELVTSVNMQTTATVKATLSDTEYVGKFVYVELDSGTIYLREIITAVVSGDDMVLTFDTALGEVVTPAATKQFCFMVQVRSDTDVFSFTYYPGLSAVTSFSALEIPDVL